MLLHTNEVEGVRRVEIERTSARVVVREGLLGQTLVEVSDITHPDVGSATAAEAALVAEYEARDFVHSSTLEPTVARFYRERFADLLVAHFGVTRGEPSTELVEQVQAIHGQSPPPELRALLELRGSAELGWCNFGEWRIWPDDLIPFDFEEGNLFEQLLERFGSYSLRLVLADLVPLGTAGNGDGYLLFLDVLQPDVAPVYFFDHETEELSVFCDSISTLAELNHLYLLDAGELPSKADVLDEVRRGMQRLEKRVSPSWHYRSVVENSGTEPTFELKGSAAPFYFFRSNWIAKLMEGDVRLAGKWFQPIAKWHQEQMVWDDIKGYWSLLLPSRGLYWLYTLYFFERPQLPEAIERCATSPSRLLRDAAAVFGELARGRTHVGRLDFAETRRRFAALGLDPVVAEQRRKQAEAARAERIAARRAQREQARAWARGRSADEIASELWRQIDSRSAVDELTQALVHADPSCARALGRAKMVASRKDGWELSLEALALSEVVNERAMLTLALVDSGLWVIDEVVNALGERERASVVEHGPLLVARLRGWLRAKYGKASAIRALDRLGLLTGEELVQAVARLRWDDRRDRDEDEDEDEGEGESEVVSTFGQLLPGDEPTASEEAAEDDEADDVNEEEAAEDEDDEDDDVNEEEAAEDEDDDDDDNNEDVEDDDVEDDDVEDDDAEADDDEHPSPIDPDEQDDPEIELDEENPLVEEPAYLRSITNKEPLRAAIEAIGRLRFPGALEQLISLATGEPKVAAIPALLAIGQLSEDEARQFLEAQLIGPHRRVAMYALARRRDARSLPAFEAVLAKRSGLPEVTVYERLMGQAILSAAGHQIELEIVRLALQTVMDNKFAAIELHEVALDLVCRHADPEEVRRTGLAFLDAEQARIRTAARALVGPATMRVLDEATLEHLFATRGPDGLREALRDDFTIHRERALSFAKQRGVLAELEPEAHALVEHMARFPHYTNGYERDGHDRTQHAISTLFELPSPATNALLHRLLTSPNASVRKAFEYQRELTERLRELGPVTPRSRLDALAGRDLSQGVRARELLESRFVLGEPVHAIAFVGDIVLVGGGGRVAAFDRSGRRHPNSDALVHGWCYDITTHERAGVVVLGYSHGHCLVHQRDGLARITELTHGGGVRKVAISPSGRWLATACDNATLQIWDLERRERVREHGEPYDVNTVVWLDDDTIAFATDQHVGVIAREAGEPRRVSTGSVAELQLVDGQLLAGTTKHGLCFIDPHTLEIGERIPITNVARARVSDDRRTVFVACWDGEQRGCWRFDRATGQGERVHDESLFGMEIDPIDRRVLIGGRSNRVTVLDADGRSITEARPERREQRETGWLVLPPGNDAIVDLTLAGSDIEVLDAGGRLVRVALDGRGRILATPTTPLTSSAEDFAHDGDGVIVAAFGRLLRYGAGPHWRRETDRCEKVVALGNAVIASSGKHLGWFAPQTGELLAERDAEVESSWIEHIIPIDQDRLFVAGYDDGRLQLWSASERRRVSEITVDHRHDDGRFARPYGIAVHAPSSRLLVSYWDDSIDVFRIVDDRFELERTLALHNGYPMLGLGVSEAGETLYLASEQAVLALAYPSCEPLWRWPSPGELTRMLVLPDARVVVGTKEGALFVVGPSA